MLREKLVVGNSLFLKNILFYLFIYLFLAVLGLCCCCCSRAFSSHSRLGFFFAVVRRLLFAGASPGAERALWGTRGSGTADVGAAVPSPGSRAQAQ